MNQDQKNEELYKAALEAFFNNELESDKTLLGLSIAAIGFYMALFTAKTTPISEIMFISIMISLIAFLISAGMILLVFTRNKKQLMNIIASTGQASEDPLLDVLDKWKYLPFVIGVLASMIFTLSLIFTNLNSGAKHVEKLKNQTVVQKDDLRDISEGFSGIATANSEVKEKGVSGICDANQTQSESNDSNTSEGHNVKSK